MKNIALASNTMFFILDFSIPRLQPFAVGQIYNESLYRQVHVLAAGGGGGGGGGGQQQQRAISQKTSMSSSAGPISLP
jgi:hypothetical protein